MDSHSGSAMRFLRSLRRLWYAHEAAALLLFVGLMLALNISVGKIAVQHGLSPLELAFGASLGAGLLLLAVSVGAGEPPPLDRRHLLAYALLGIVSFAIPAAMNAVVASRVGVGYASVIGSLSPILTLALATTLRIE